MSSGDLWLLNVSIRYASTPSSVSSPSVLSISSGRSIEKPVITSPTTSLSFRARDSPRRYRLWNVFADTSSG